MKYDIIKYYGFLTHEEYEAYCFAVMPDGMNMRPMEGGGVRSDGIKWAVKSIVNTYPKDLAGAKAELRRRGLDPGDEEYGLVKVMEDGDVNPENGLWTPSDIFLAMISLAELDCIEPWIFVCRSFNIKPVDFVKAQRKIAEETVEFLGEHAETPLFFRYEFGFADSLGDPGVLSIKLRDDWERILQRIHGS